MGYMDKGDRMADSFASTAEHWNGWKKLSFCLLDFAILSSYIVLAYCVIKRVHMENFYIA